MSDKIRVIIADDEPAARTSIQILLSDEHDFEVVDLCKDGNETLEAILNLKPDLVFLDIQMPELNGLEVIESLEGRINTCFILVTAYDMYAIEAFEKAAIDYLLKPYDDSRFYQSLYKARRSLTSEKIAEQLLELKEILHNLKPARIKKYAENISIKFSGRIYLQPVENIRYVESEGNFIKIFTTEGLKPANYTFKQFLDVIDPLCFIRIHKSFIINKKFVESVEPYFHGDYFIHLKGGEKLRMSRSYKDSLDLILS